MMAHRRIGQERLGLSVARSRGSSLDDLAGLIDWVALAGGEPAWPPLAMFRALLLSVWYDLSDVKLAEALDDREAVRAWGRTPRVAATGLWGADEQETLANLAAFNTPVHRVHSRTEKIFGTC